MLQGFGNNKASKNNNNNLVDEPYLRPKVLLISVTKSFRLFGAPLLVRTSPVARNLLFSFMLLNLPPNLQFQGNQQASI